MEGGRSVRVESACSGGESGQAPSAAGDIFAPFSEASPERPFVVGQLGQSLDGRIATLAGDSRDISGEAALDHLHRIRAHVDAVVVGARTIVMDDPRLSVRRVAGTNPARVVIDPSGRLDSRGRWLAEDGARRILVTSETASASCAAETIRLEARAGVIPPAAIVEALFALRLRRILVEGGARTLSTFVEAGRLDRLHVLVAPMIIGSGQAGLELPPIAKLASALRPRVRAHLLDGGDVLFDCDLSDCRRWEI
jgi:riboflavin-specific deaminase-like protein